jgi:hypothetical protein
VTLASLLPGLRELRAPLAAGYTWFAFFFLTFGAPTAISDLPGPIEDLAREADSFGAAAKVTVASFLAYLVGSISQDVFGRVLPRGLHLVSRRFSARDRLSTYLFYELTQLADALTRLASGPEPLALDARDQAFARVQGLEEVTREMRAAGASESEKPEALRPMVEAEENLRMSIVPPFAALSVAIALSSPTVGVVGLAFSLVLYIQAVARHIEADRLARRFRQVQGLQGVLALLPELRRLLMQPGRPSEQEIHPIVTQIAEAAEAAGVVPRGHRLRPKGV